ncbi:hypothetical protein QPM17_21980 [Marinobacter sp. TBZ242]|uniref:Uncharacterized protein n=1 Tax=Marinobacter azerbaijanicus TaxID=3050455 RepID=A0ABT7IL50_9GAMM|nr:hypothetical protein [Marinobacter sp. TBZ242]MDL0433814.1 hypothetical protein [Marinobacter sp. TBZ242]
MAMKRSAPSAFEPLRQHIQRGINFQRAQSERDAGISRQSEECSEACQCPHEEMKTNKHRLMIPMKAYSERLRWNPEEAL